MPLFWPARLLRGDSYGYEINKVISTLSSGRFELKEATLYTAFKRLEEQGYIASYWGNSGAGARRRYYTITPSGRLASKRLAALLHHHPIRPSGQQAIGRGMARNQGDHGQAIGIGGRIMREQLIQYVELLFAGARDCEDVKQEILQNTLDRYDDLIAEGKVPEAAYRLAITGIGDINEILGSQPSHAAPQPNQSGPEVDSDKYRRLQRPEAAYRLAITGIGDINEILGSQPSHAAPQPNQSGPEVDSDKYRRLQRGIAIACFILCPVPLLLCVVEGQVMIGITMMLVLIAVGTMLMVVSGKDQAQLPRRHSSLFVSIAMSLLWPLTTIVYFLISFSTGAWHLTWLVFPIAGAISAVIRAIEDWKEENNHEA